MTTKLQQAQLDEWPQCEPFLRAALETTSDWAIEDVALAVMQGTVGLHVLKTTENGAVIGAGVLSVVTYPKRKVLDVLLFSGYGDWAETFDQLKALGKELGCVALTGRGRKGWIRRLDALPLNQWEIPIQLTDPFDTEEGC
jgi:hypothetical protein